MTFTSVEAFEAFDMGANEALVAIADGAARSGSKAWDEGVRNVVTSSSELLRGALLDIAGKSGTAEEFVSLAADAILSEMQFLGGTTRALLSLKGWQEHSILAVLNLISYVTAQSLTGFCQALNQYNEGDPGNALLSEAEAKHYFSM